MIKSIRSIAGACALTIAITGCHDNAALAETSTTSSASPSPSTLAPQSPETADTMNVIGGDRRGAATSWSEYLRSVDEEDRKFLEDISSRYYGAVQFGNAREREELSRLGIPLPGEWLSSRDHSDEELAKLGDAGDAKALIFLTDRLIAKMSDTRSKAGESSYLSYVKSLPDDMRSPGQQDLAEASGRASASYIISPKPFTAYQYGIATAEVTGSPDIVPASIAIAGELGDARAENILASYYKTGPRSDDAAVLQAEEAMRQMSRSALDRK